MVLGTKTEMEVVGRRGYTIGLFLGKVRDVQAWKPKWRLVSNVRIRGAASSKQEACLLGKSGGREGVGEGRGRRRRGFWEELHWGERTDFLGATVLESKRPWELSKVDMVPPPSLASFRVFLGPYFLGSACASTGEPLLLAHWVV